MKYVLVLTLLVACTACSSRTAEKAKAQDQSDTIPTLNKTLVESKDSIQLLYYKKPFEDKERYTRYFSSATIADSLLKSYLGELLLLPGTKQDSIKPCLSEGKILLPKGGDAFIVVYFSRLPNSCRYLYVIRNGAFYYYEMDPRVEDRLNELEKFAKEPI